VTAVNFTTRQLAACYCYCGNLGTPESGKSSNCLNFMVFQIDQRTGPGQFGIGIAIGTGATCRVVPFLASTPEIPIRRGEFGSREDEEDEDEVEVEEGQWQWSMQA